MLTNSIRTVASSPRLLTSYASTLLAGLVLLTPGWAQAGAYDGLYAVDYTQVTSDLKVCASYQSYVRCQEVHISAPLEEGLLTEFSLQMVMDDWIAHLEQNTSHDVRPEVEAHMDELVAFTYDQMAEQLNVVLMSLPEIMDIRQSRAVPEVIQVILSDEEDSTQLPAVGSLEVSTGLFALPAIFSGRIEPNACQTGWGSAALPLGFAVEDHGVTVTVSGRVAATFTMARQASQSPTLPSQLRR